MKHRLLDILVCPECQASLELESVEEESGQIRTGFLHCSEKGCKYPITNFVPRFIDSDKYVDSFSVQRQYTRRYFDWFKKDRQGHALFTPTTGFKEEDLKEGITLEAGCGYGRFLDVVDKMGGEVVGFDLSTDSIELAQDFVGLRENVHLVQGDANNPPFRKEVFDRIYSIGVLHHTPDTKAAFSSLVPFLKKGGDIAIWVYAPETVAAQNRWLPVTNKLPPKVLFAWCVVNELLFFWIRKLPGIGWRFANIVPGSVKAHFPFWIRVISNYDGLSPKYAFTHTPEEVKQWFVEVGLKDIEVLQRRTSVKGRK